MKITKTPCIAILVGILTGCNHTGINPKYPESPAASSSAVFKEVTVYSADVKPPRNSRMLAKVTAQNKYPDGSRVASQDIIIELKRQALLVGANGLMHITPGTGQTTADAYLIH